MGTNVDKVSISFKLKLLIRQSIKESITLSSQLTPKPLLRLQYLDKVSCTSSELKFINNPAGKI